MFIFTNFPLAESEMMSIYEAEIGVSLHTFRRPSMKALITKQTINALNGKQKKN